MKISMMLKIILLGMLLIAPLNAQEADENTLCAEKYDACTLKCESLEDGYEQCTEKCDLEFDACSESEDNNQKDSD